MLYIISLAVILILIFMDLIGNKRINVQPILAKTSSKQIIGQEPVLRQEPLRKTSLTSNPRPAITIVKPPLKQKEKPVLPVPEPKEAKIREAQNPDQSASQSYSAGGEEPVDNNGDAPVTGITKINKYPTEEETKDMNSRGVIMY